jgi:hypothetical protein
VEGLPMMSNVTFVSFLRARMPLTLVMVVVNSNNITDKYDGIQG